MDFKELVDLISIRQYVVNSISNPVIDRATVNDMNGTLLLLDKKIIELLRSVEFREYIGYKNVQKAKEEAAYNTNVKSSFFKKPI